MHVGIYTLKAFILAAEKTRVILYMIHDTTFRDLNKAAGAECGSQATKIHSFSETGEKTHKTNNNFIHAALK